jgi:hypothetical protein
VKRSLQISSLKFYFPLFFHSGSRTSTTKGSLPWLLPIAFAHSCPCTCSPKPSWLSTPHVHTILHTCMHIQFYTAHVSSLCICMVWSIWYSCMDRENACMHSTADNFHVQHYKPGVSYPVVEMHALHIHDLFPPVVYAYIHVCPPIPCVHMYTHTSIQDQVS